jgi:hypothetical protein
MAMCPVVVALGGGEEIPSARPAHDAVVALIATPPLSRIETPDPPPPKA